MNRTQMKKILRDRRRKRIRAKVYGTGERPRIAVYRSNAYTYVQLINDEIAQTLAAANSGNVQEGATPVERAHAAGKELARQAKQQGIEHAIFDRGGFIYAGRVRALADGAREGGLQF
jgi:large subunit ribosomal protein L18